MMGLYNFQFNSNHITLIIRLNYISCLFFCFCFFFHKGKHELQNLSLKSQVHNQYIYFVWHNIFFAFNFLPLVFLFVNMHGNGVRPIYEFPQEKKYEFPQEKKNEFPQEKKMQSCHLENK